jgi:type II restriction enzyme
MPSLTSSPINTQNVEVDDYGNAVVDTSIVVAITDARFGEKVYAYITEVASKTAEQESSKLTSAVATAFTHGVLDTVKEIAKDNAVTVAQAEQVVKQNANTLAREVEIVKKQAEIRQAEATVEYYREIAAAANDSSAVSEAKARYEITKQEITETLIKEIMDKVEEKTKELTQKSTEEILQKAEKKRELRSRMISAPVCAALLAQFRRSSWHTASRPLPSPPSMRTSKMRCSKRLLALLLTSLERCVTLTISLTRLSLTNPFRSS